MLADGMIETLSGMKETIEAECQRMQSEHSKADLLVTDILHEIEFGCPDACTMVVIQKDLKKALVNRRKVKDEATKLQSLKSMFSSYKNVVKASKNLEGRTYTPRILKALDFKDASALLKSRKNLPA